MSSPRKSTDSKSSPERDWGEDLARLHCLQALFPDLTDPDRFLLRQMKESIEASIRQQASADTFENFSSAAATLSSQFPGTLAGSHAFISIDFSNRTWDPLFARQEIIRHLKQQAGVQHIFLLVRGLRSALCPAAKYRTKARDEAHQQALTFMDELARHWSTPSSTVHLLYL